MPQAAAAAVPLPPELEHAPGLTVTVKSFRFAGNTLLSDEQLAPVVASFLDRELDFNALQKTAVAVAEFYRAAGWLVRVYLPRQAIEDGVVTLQIVEGKFGQLRFDGLQPQRFSVELAQSYINAAQASGESINARAVDRVLLVLDDLPGVAASGNLAAGSGPAETDIVLKLVDEPAFNGDIVIDNTGSRATGRERWGTNATLNSPLKVGDLLGFNLMHTEGSNYSRLAYSVPLGYNGLRLGLNTSNMNYRVISAELLSANVQGKSSTWGLNAQYPLLRSRSQNLYLSAGYDDKSFHNQANQATTTQYGMRNLTMGVMGNAFDALGGGGANMASLTLTHGNLDLNGSPNQATDASTTQAQGMFSKLAYAFSRQQTLTSELSLYGLVSGQLASKSLDSAEKFYLGGSGGVRAYPASEGGGSIGSMLNLELRWKAGPDLAVIGFYDWGSVTVNKSNNYSNAPALNRYELQGAGMTVQWSDRYGAVFKLTYAHRLGSNPNPTSTGTDQDGTLLKNRIWINVSLPL